VYRVRAALAEWQVIHVRPQGAGRGVGEDGDLDRGERWQAPAVDGVPGAVLVEDDRAGVVEDLDGAEEADEWPQGGPVAVLDLDRWPVAGDDRFACP
jgi:hypothetical protein